MNSTGNLQHWSWKSSWKPCIPVIPNDLCSPSSPMKTTWALLMHLNGLSQGPHPSLDACSSDLWELLLTRSSSDLFLFLIISATPSKCHFFKKKFQGGFIWSIPFTLNPEHLAYSELFLKLHWHSIYIYRHKHIHPCLPPKYTSNWFLPKNSWRRLMLKAVIDSLEWCLTFQMLIK